MRLKHPNVVQCLGAVVHPHRMVLDWMQNGEVMDYLRKNPDASRINLVDFLWLCCKETTPLIVTQNFQVLGVTKGLDYLHSRGVIHGDVKPVGIPFNSVPGGMVLTGRKNNILVNSNGDACLADFGLAIVARDKRSTGPEDPTVLGYSSLCAAPETLSHARISRETDVFSYSLVAIEVSSFRDQLTLRQPSHPDIQGRTSMG